MQLDVDDASPALSITLKMSSDMMFMPTSSLMTPS